MSDLPPPDPSAAPAGGTAPIAAGTLRPELAPPREPHSTLPWQAGVGALAVLTVSLLVSKYSLDWLVEYEWPIAVYVAYTVAIGYGPSVAWWVYASRRWGSGRLIDDVGARPRWADVGWAPVIWVAALGAQIVFAAFVIGLDLPFSNNTEEIDSLAADRSYAVAIVIAAVVAAPIVEEIVFRGLVMRSMLDVMPALPAVALQGVLFGVAHVDPVRGAGNIGLAIVLSGVGIAFGGAAYLLRRIGPTVFAHAIFNGAVMVLLLSGLSDRVREDNPDFFDSAPADIADRVGPTAGVS